MLGQHSATTLQLSVWPNIFNSDKSKQSQGWMLRQLIALNCRPICCFSHVTGQKLQFICAVYCKQYFGQRIAHCSCRLAKPRAIGWRKEGPLSYIQTVHCCKYIQWHRGVLQYILGLGGGSYTATQYSLANYAILKTAFSFIELGV